MEQQINIQTNLSKVSALANFLGVNENEIETLSYDEDLFSINNGNQEYLVLTDREADQRAYSYIKDTAWAFNASFILEECGLDYSREESLQAMQEKSSEDANDFIVSLIEKTCGMQQFVDDAISADGRGHFLSGYDGEENEEGEYYIYRTN